MHCNSIVQCIYDMTWKAICSLHLITGEGPFQKRSKKYIYEALPHLHGLLMAKAPEPLGDYPVIKDGSLLCYKSSTVTGINNQSQREGDDKKKKAHYLIYVLLGAGWCGDLLLFLAQEHRLSKQPEVRTTRFERQGAEPCAGSLLEELSSHRTRAESGGSPTNHPSLSETALRRVARTGLHGLLIHGEVFPLVLAGLVGTAPLCSRLQAGALRWCVRLVGAALQPGLRPGKEWKSLLSPALPT